MRSLSNQGPRVLIWHAYSYYKVAFRGILASIIEMLLYGKQCVSLGYYCCKNKNYSHLPRLQKKHS